MRSSLWPYIGNMVQYWYQKPYIGRIFACLCVIGGTRDMTVRNWSNYDT